MSGRMIKVIIPLKGISTGARKIQFEADGFKGEGCKAATEIFTKALGVVDTEEVKQEMYEQEERREFLTDG